MTHRTLGCTLILALSLLVSQPGRAADLIDRQMLDQLDLQLYWQAQAPLEANDFVRRIVALDDNLYILTELNRVIAVHAPTGIIRWGREVAPPGQTVRGPTHSKTDAVFTTTTSVRLFNRRTGLLAGEPRQIRGYLIEVRGDNADANVGALHGVAVGDVLDVYRGDVAAGVKPLARFKITGVRERDSTGRFIESQQRNPPRAGDRAAADIRMPIVELDVPFSPSSAAVSDGENVYFGAANQRFYALSIRHGYRTWELLTPRTVTAQPVLDGDDLYIVGRDGTVNKIAAKERTRVWPAAFRTEGPIFARPTATPERVYVASSDRSVYALDARTGRRRWRERFDAELLEPPVASGDLVYQYVPRSGVVALSAEDGGERWRAQAGLRMLTRVGEFAFILAGAREEQSEAATAAALMRYEVKTGDPRGLIDLPNISFAAGTLAPAAVFFVDRVGRVLCARSATEPHLKPAELAEAMRDESAAAAIAGVDQRLAAERRAKQAAARRPGIDPFASRTTVPPAAGPGLVPPTPTSEPASAKPTTTAEADKPDTTEPAEDDAKTDESESGEEKPAPDADKEKPAADEEKEAPAAEEGSDEKPADDAGGEEKPSDDEKPPDDETPPKDDN